MTTPAAKRKFRPSTTELLLHQILFCCVGKEAASIIIIITAITTQRPNWPSKTKSGIHCSRVPHKEPIPSEKQHARTSTRQYFHQHHHIITPQAKYRPTTLLSNGHEKRRTSQQVVDAAKKETTSNQQKNNPTQQSSPHCSYPRHYCLAWNSVIISFGNGHIECCSHNIHGPAMSSHCITATTTHLYFNLDHRCANSQKK